MEWSEVLGIVADVLGIMSAIPIFYLANHFRKKLRGKNAEDTAKAPIRKQGVIMITGEKNNNICQNVYNFLAEDSELRKIPKKNIVEVEIKYSGNENTTMLPEDSDPAYKKIDNARQKLKNLGVETVHVFIGSLMPVAFMAGENFSNAFNLKFYHFVKGNKGYELFSEL